MTRQTRSLLLVFVVIFLALFLLYPVGSIFLRSVRIDGAWRLWNIELFLLDKRSIQILATSVGLGLSVAAVSSLVGLVVAWVMFRSRFPGKSFCELCFLAPWFLPPFVGLLGIKSICNRYGLIPVDLFVPGSSLGIILLQTVHLFPLCYMTIRSALEKIPYEALEAATMLGCSRLMIARKIILPLLVPSLGAGFVLSLLGSLSDVGTPLLFEYRSHVAVQIFNTVFDLPVVSSGYVLVLVLLLIVLCIFAVKRSFERFPVHFDVRSIRPWPHLDVRGSVKSFVLILCVFGLALVCILPQVSLLLLSSAELWFMSPLPQQYGIASFVQAFIHPITTQSFLYSVCLAAVAATCVATMSFVIAYAVQRDGSLLSRFLLFVSLLPLAIPGLIIAFGLATGFAGTLLDPRHAPTILLMAAYVVRKLPFGVTLMQSSLKQIPQVYEEAAIMCGAGSYALFRRIMFPLYRSILGSILIITFLSSLFEVSASLLLPMEEKYFPIAKALYALQSRPDGLSLAAAYAVLVMLMTMLGFFMTARWQNRSIASLIRGSA